MIQVDKYGNKLILNFSNFLKDSNTVDLATLIKDNNYELNEIYMIIINDTPITNITGLAYFNSLKCLNIANNNINKLSELPNNIEEIDCSGNCLTCLTLSSRIKRLNCSNNKIKSIFSDSLEILYCTGNLIEDINCKSLVKLTCDNNRITMLNNVRNLLYLNCANNNILQIPNIPYCQELYINGNQLKNISIDSKWTIKVLYAYNNPIETIGYILSLREFSCDNKDNIVISDMYKIKEVILENNYIVVKL